MPKVREYTQQIGAEGAIQGRRAAPGDTFALGSEIGQAFGGVADVLAFLLSFANVAGIDLTQALRDKMERNAVKYPVEEYKGRY